MSSSAREPVAAKVLDDPAPQLRPRRDGRGWLVGGVFVLFVAGVFGLLWGLGKMLVNVASVRPARSDSVLGHWETPTERVAAIKAALDADNPGLSAAEIRELRKFFDRVVQSLHLQSSMPFVGLVDAEECALRVVRHPASQAHPQQRRLLEQQLHHRLATPPPWTELTIVHGERNPHGDEVLIYTLAAGQDLPPSPVRWWLRRDGRTWKICDWERVDRGASAAARWALDSANESSPQYASYRQAVDGLRAAEGHLKTGHLALAARDLLGAQVGELPAALHDLVQLDLAWSWEQCARSDQVLAACARVRDVAANPAVHYLRALAYARREDFANVSAAAAEYRAAAGRHPHLLELEATALEALGRRPEAAECWWQQLTLLPEDTDALAEFCRLADDRTRGRARTILRRAREPQEFALQTARAAIFRDDEATVSVIEQFLRETEPQSPVLELLAGLTAEHRGDHVAAAERFRAAAERAGDSDERLGYFHQYLSALARAGRAAEGYAAAPDACQALAFLTTGLEYDDAVLTLKDLPPVLALHRQRAPEDPRLYYLDALVASDKGDYAAAESLLNTALTKIKPADKPKSDGGADLASLCRSELVGTLYRQQRYPQAYAEAAKDVDANAFRQLAWLCHQDRNWTALDKLITLHRAQRPADPWIDYFLALRAQDEGDAPVALAAVQRAENVADESLRPTLAWLKNQLLIQSGGIAQAYQGSSDQREAFRRLVAHLAAQEDWAGVLELAKLHASLAPRRSATLYWSVAAHWHLGQYQEIVDLLSPWPDDRVNRLEPGQLAELCDLLVRSHLRLNKPADAQAAADRARDDYGIEPPLVALALAQGDREGLLELLQQPRIGRTMFEQQLYRDHDLARLLTDPDVAEIRRRQAPPVPSDRGTRNVSLILFFAEPLPAEQFQEISARSSARATALDDWHDRRSLLWEQNLEAVVLTAASQPYCTSDLIPGSLAASDPRRGVLEKHGGWVAIDLLPAEERVADSPMAALAGKLAAALADCRPQAICLSSPSSHRLDLFDDAGRKRLETGWYFAAGASPPTSVPQSQRQRDNVVLFANGPQRDLAEWSSRSRALRQLADGARVANPAGHALVRVALRRGHAVEEQWLKVIRSRRLKYGDDEFIAELTQDSKLWPFLKTGERVRLASYEPLEVAPVAASTADCIPSSEF